MKRNQQLRTCFLIIFLISGLNFYAMAQQKQGKTKELKRRAFFGVMAAPVTEAQQKEMKLPSTQGVLVQKLPPGGSFAAAGLQENDFITQVGEHKVPDTKQFVATASKFREGDVAEVTWWRNGKQFRKKVTMKGVPKETSSAYDVIYSQVSYDGNTVRSILTKPRENKKMPALLIIGGVGCYSIDNPHMGPGMHGPLVEALTKAGYVTMRIEKTGMGDSQGKPCSEANFQDEVNGYVAALQELKKLDYVDENNLFIFGHSMGGFLAPVVTERVPVKGIVVYGTGSKRWLDYELHNSKTQPVLLGEAAPSDLDMKRDEQFLKLWLQDKMAPQQIVKEYPELEQPAFNRHMQGATIHGQHYTFFQQLADITPLEKWQKTNAYVYAIHGRSDFVSYAEEHKAIADAVNSRNPGHGKFLDMENIDHWFNQVPTPQESARAMDAKTKPQQNPKIVEEVLNWMKEVVQKRV